MNPTGPLERELCMMIIECCSQERTYVKFYGLMAQRFCMLGTHWQGHFTQLFSEQYENIHLLETNRIRNVTKFFAHLLSGDAIPWTVLECIKLNEVSFFILFYFIFFPQKNRN